VLATTFSHYYGETEVLRDNQPDITVGAGLSASSGLSGCGSRPCCGCLAGWSSRPSARCLQNNWGGGPPPPPTACWLSNPLDLCVPGFRFAAVAPAVRGNVGAGARITGWTPLRPGAIIGRCAWRATKLTEFADACAQNSFLAG